LKNLKVVPAKGELLRCHGMTVEEAKYIKEFIVDDVLSPVTSEPESPMKDMIEDMQKICLDEGIQLVDSTKLVTADLVDSTKSAILDKSNQVYRIPDSIKHKQYTDETDKFANRYGGSKYSYYPPCRKKVFEREYMSPGQALSYQDIPTRIPATGSWRKM
jgi:hypothetical protein